MSPETSARTAPSSRGPARAGPLGVSRRGLSSRFSATLDPEPPTSWVGTRDAHHHEFRDFGGDRKVARRRQRRSLADISNNNEAPG
jgi:hypothetical protein